MPWPQPTDYNEAVQSPALCFADAELRQGQAEGDLFGLPRPYSGNFANVYRLLCPGGQSWAVKCFTREVPRLHDRYHAVSEHLRRAHRPFMVDYRYLDQGIRVHGNWYPVLKMRWVEGLALNDFLRDHADDRPVLDQLAALWLRLAQEMRSAGIAHGDLQHGNVLLV